MAIGSLLSDPTMEYVVDEVVRTHQAEAYDMPNADAPEKIIAQMRAWRCSSGLYIISRKELILLGGCVVASLKAHLQVHLEISRWPVFKE